MDKIVLLVTILRVGTIMVNKVIFFWGIASSINHQGTDVVTDRIVRPVNAITQMCTPNTQSSNPTIYTAEALEPLDNETFKNLKKL